MHPRDENAWLDFRTTTNRRLNSDGYEVIGRNFSGGHAGKLTPAQAQESLVVPEIPAGFRRRCRDLTLYVFDQAANRHAVTVYIEDIECAGIRPDHEV